MTGWISLRVLTRVESPTNNFYCPNTLVKTAVCLVMYSNGAFTLSETEREQEYFVTIAATHYE